MSLIEATARLAETNAKRLPPNYIWATLKDRDQDAEIRPGAEPPISVRVAESR